VQARTRAAILHATASVLAANRLATLPEIANAAGVGRTTLHRYFADRETLIYEATLDSIRVLLETANEAAVDQGPAIEAMRRVIAALVSVGDRVLFLFGDPAVLRNIPPSEHPNEELLISVRPGPQRDVGSTRALRVGAPRVRGGQHRRTAPPRGRAPDHPHVRARSLRAHWGAYVRQSTAECGIGSPNLSVQLFTEVGSASTGRRKDA
jgi:AcrR family transcriptional regulator